MGKSLHFFAVTVVAVGMVAIFGISIVAFVHLFGTMEWHAHLFVWSLMLFCWAVWYIDRRVGSS